MPPSPLTIPTARSRHYLGPFPVRFDHPGPRDGRSRQPESGSIVSMLERRIDREALAEVALFPDATLLISPEHTDE